MYERVAEFLVHLSQDPFLAEEFAREPDLVLREAGLAEEAREVLRSGDPARIHRYLGSHGSLAMSSTQSAIAPKPPPPPPPPPKPPGPPPGTPNGQ